MSDRTKYRASVVEVEFTPEGVTWKASTLDGRRMFRSVKRRGEAAPPQLGDVFIYTVDARGYVVGEPEPEAPLLSEQKFNEWIERRMGRLNFESEPAMTQMLVRDAFMAGRAEVRPRDYLMASEL